MSKVFTLNIAPSAAAAGTVSATQTPGAGLTMLINGTLATGGVATIAAAQLITLVNNFNDSAITATITGTDPDGGAQSEAVTMPNAGTATGLKFFKTVTSITVSAALGGTFASGNSIISASPTYWPNVGENPFNIGILAKLASGGTATFALNQHYERMGTYPADGLWFAHATLTGLTSSTAGSLIIPVVGIRIRVSAYSAGPVSAQFVQAGV